VPETLDATAWRRPESDQRLRAAAGFLQRMLDEPAGIHARWRTLGFVRCVESIRLHLWPIGSQAALADSFGREASRHEALEMAYALRWLELADGIGRPSWSALSGDRLPLTARSAERLYRRPRTRCRGCC
jgi:hypothetical protein